MVEPVEPRSPWQRGTVLAITPETARASTFRFRLERPVVHRAGQHYVLRLTAPDGYTAQRSYSVASAPDDSGTIELTVERLDDGEVSGFLHDEVQVGDELELRGPIGGWFVWDGDRPAVLLGGGSGVVPLMAMLRLARTTGRTDLVQLVVSVRTPEDLYYPDEIVGPQTSIVYTRLGAARVGPTARSADQGRPRRARRRRCHLLRLRLGRVRRCRIRPARRRRRGSRTDQGRALRSERLSARRGERRVPEACRLVGSAGHRGSRIVSSHCSASAAAVAATVDSGATRSKPCGAPAYTRTSVGTPARVSSTA